MTIRSTFDIPTNGTATPVGPGAVPPAPVLPPPRRRRRPLLIAAGVVLVVLGALGAYALAEGGSQRIGVIGIAADVPWGARITPADLVEARIVADPSLRPLRWSDEASVVGRRVDTALHPGGLLTEADLMTVQIPRPGEALVGVAAKPGLLPATPLTPGERVLLVPTGSGAQTGPSVAPPAPDSGVVLAVGAADPSGARTVDVLVDRGEAAQVASWSAAGTVAVVVVAGR